MASPTSTNQMMPQIDIQAIIDPDHGYPHIMTATPLSRTSRQGALYTGVACTVRGLIASDALGCGHSAADASLAAQFNAAAVIAQPARNCAGPTRGAITVTSMRPRSCRRWYDTQ